VWLFWAGEALGAAWFARFEGRAALTTGARRPLPSIDRLVALTNQIREVNAQVEELRERESEVSSRTDCTAFDNPREYVAVVGMPHVDVVNLRKGVSSSDRFFERRAGNLLRFPHCGNRV
jgi:hypothetical protein